MSLNDLITHAVIRHLSESGLDMATNADLKTAYLELSQHARIDLLVNDNTVDIGANVEPANRQMSPTERHHAYRILGNFNLSNPDSFEAIHRCIMQARYDYFTNSGTMAEWVAPKCDPRYEDKRTRERVRIFQASR
jgi:hypothetical protein